MNNFWAGGWEGHYIEIKRGWLRERLRLLFKRKSADTPQEKKEIKSELKELDKKYSQQKKDTYYNMYFA